MARCGWKSRIAGLVLVVAGFVAVPGTLVGWQDPVIPHAQDRPPNPARTPAEAIAAMTVPPGFTVEVVAAEPDLVNPVAMTFDERGRIWVTESLEYPRREAGPGRDRIKVLEDTDGDGRADRFHVFADGLNIPSGIAVGHGGVWVANSPDLLFYPDADRDARPDGPPEVVVTGFGRDDTHELPSSLTWGPDGWLYGWNGVFNPSRVTNRKGQTLDFTCAIFRVDPRTRDFELFCEGTSNPWGIAVNDRGDLFASACVIDHLWHLAETAYYIRQGGPYPAHTWPMSSIVSHKHQKAAYCGIHWFDSEAYPPEYRRRLYMGNIHGGGINVDTIVPKGSTYQGEPAPDFLTADDAWFMPVAQKTGPDGSLYILDWYDRYHCYQDANRDPKGIDRLKGRLYRVRYQDTPRVAIDLAARSDDELVNLLAGPNDFLRSTARRLLVERCLAKGQEAGPIVERLAELVRADGTLATTRSEALFTLASVATLEGGRQGPEAGSLPLRPAGFFESLLTSADPLLRAWSVRVLGNRRIDARAAAALEPPLTRLAADPAPEVRLQVAIAARKIPGLDPLPVLLDTLAASDGDPLIAHVVWQNLHPLLSSRGVDFVAAVRRRGDPGGAIADLLPRALPVLLATPAIDPGLVAELTSAQIASDPALAAAMLDTLRDQVRTRQLAGARAEALRSRLLPALEPCLAAAEPPHPLRDDAALLAALWKQPLALARCRAMLETDALETWRRIRALESLLAARDDATLPAVARLLEAGEEELRGEVIEALTETDDPAVGPLMITTYPRLDAGTRPRVVVLLTERSSWARDLLAAIEGRTIPATALNLNQIRKLQAAKDPELTRRVQAIWGTIRDGRNPQRERVVAAVRGQLGRMGGDPLAGRQVFGRLCAQCHVLHGQGQNVGPDITTNGRNDFDQLLSNVLDPNLVIGPGYQATTVATADGRVLTGLLAEDSRERVVLKLQGGQQEVIPRGEVEEMRTSEVSLMPEEIETQLTPRELADLFAYLVLDRPPEDPQARRLPGAPAPQTGKPAER